MLWVLCEIAIAACDLAEVIGSAIALNLLFGIPLVVGRAASPPLDVLVVLYLQNKGFRYIEALVVGADLRDRRLFRLRNASSRSPAVAAMLRRASCPAPEIVTNPAMLYIAIGILGATVMPHNLYLHSSIVQTRAVRARPTRASARRSSSPPSTRRWR